MFSLLTTFRESYGLVFRDVMRLICRFTTLSSTLCLLPFVNRIAIRKKEETVRRQNTWKQSTRIRMGNSVNHLGLGELLGERPRR